MEMEEKEYGTSTADIASRNTCVIKNETEQKKEVISKRPWRFGSVELPFTAPDGTEYMAWYPAVIDATGKPVCIGSSENMKFIVERENSFNENNKENK